MQNALRPPTVRWSIETSDGVYGLQLDRERVITAGSELITAYSLRDGSIMWENHISETSGATFMEIVDEAVIVSPPFADSQAFVLATGEEALVPRGYDDSREAENFFACPLAKGYEFAAQELRYQSRRIWAPVTPREDAVVPVARRFGPVTIVNDYHDGVFIVDDEGTVLAAPSYHSREYGQTPVYIRETVAIAVSSDGYMHLIGQ
jgi:hypothetical protein